MRDKSGEDLMGELDAEARAQEMEDNALAGGAHEVYEENADGIIVATKG